MKILFINQYYWPDVAATAQQLTDLAEFLAARGHSVDVLCSQGLYEDVPGVELKRRERHEGVTIRRLPQWGSRRRGLVWRLLAYVGFDLLCLLWVLIRGWRFDVIVTLTEPPLTGMFGVLVRALSLGRVKHVAWSMDLYTDCMFALGTLRRRSPLGLVLELLNRLELRAADATVVLGECMRERVIGKGVDPRRLHVIGVWNRGDQLVPAAIEGNPLRHELGLDGRFIVMYSGNAGRSHSFDAICQSMLDLKDDPRIEFVFAGGGKRLGDVAAFARRHELANFRRLPYAARERLNESLGIGNVHLVSLHPRMAGVVVPCKLYGIMGVGRPVLFVGPAESTVAREVTAAGAGLAFGTDQAAELSAAISRLAADTKACQRMGENGRRFFLEHHEREVCCRQWEAVLRSVVGESREPVAAAATHADKGRATVRRAAE
jgi:glycosyltransferase involved in cell wall biosynthesis